MRQFVCSIWDCSFNLHLSSCSLWNLCSYPETIPLKELLIQSARSLSSSLWSSCSYPETIPQGNAHSIYLFIVVLSLELSLLHETIPLKELLIQSVHFLSSSLWCSLSYPKTIPQGIAHSIYMFSIVLFLELMLLS